MAPPTTRRTNRRSFIYFESGKPNTNVFAMPFYYYIHHSVRFRTFSNVQASSLSHLLVAKVNAPGNTLTWMHKSKKTTPPRRRLRRLTILKKMPSVKILFLHNHTCNTYTHDIKNNISIHAMMNPFPLLTRAFSLRQSATVHIRSPLRPDLSGMHVSEPSRHSCTCIKMALRAFRSHLRDFDSLRRIGSLRRFTT